MPKRLTPEEFIIKAKIIHGDKYDYSKVDYINTRTKVCIICPEHGVFWQVPSSHLSGHGCLKCAIDYTGEMNRATKAEFVEMSNIKHNNKFEYSKVDYISTKTKVCIICPEHGEFLQTPNDHLQNKGCPKCGVISRTEIQTLSGEGFVKKCMDVHGDRYDYSKVKYVHGQTKVVIICPEHGEFTQTPSEHSRGSGCPTCKESRGERVIRIHLEEHNINYKTQHTFTDCKDKYILRFDFYLPDYTLLIEYDGKQHFEPNDFFGGVEMFKNTQKRDKIKNDYVDSVDNLSLLRVPYTEFDNISTILSDVL